MDPSRSRLRRLTRALVYAVVVAVPLAVLSFLVRSGFAPLVDLDEAVTMWATDITRAHAGLRSVARVWEQVSQPWVVYLLVGLPACALAWARLHLRTGALWALATMASGWGLATLLKLAVRRARPVVDGSFAAHSGYSFPSGHATNNAIVATVVVALLGPALGVVARRALTAAATLWVVLTCADRIFLGAHFLSDVVAGVLLGSGFCLASRAGYLGWRPPVPTPTSGATR